MEKGVKYTKSQILAVNRAITRVRDTQNMMGQTIPGCVFPSAVMFLNAWNQNSIKGEVEGIVEAMKPERKKHQDKEEKWKKGGAQKFIDEEK